MALINCPECGKEISDKSEKCINCGYPIKELKYDNEVMHMYYCKQCDFQNGRQEDYCSRCGTRLTSYVEYADNNVNSEKYQADYSNYKLKESGLSVVAAVLAVCTITCIFGVIIALIDILTRDKTTKHRGSWFAIIWFAIIIICVGLSKSEESNDTSSYQSTSTMNADDESNLNYSGTSSESIDEELVCEFSYKRMNVKYLKHEVIENNAGETVLVVYYEFTNNSDENKVFDYSFSDTCFQNGIEIEHSYWHANDESKNSGKEIKNGTTVIVSSSFVLGDNITDVELEITPWLSDEILFSMTIELE